MEAACKHCGTLITIKSKYAIGQKVSWRAPYGWETVTIKDIKVKNDFICGIQVEYFTEEYTFWLDESELGE